MTDLRAARRPVLPRWRRVAVIAGAGALLLVADIAMAQQQLDPQTRAYRERTEVRLSQLESQVRQLTGATERLQFSIDRLSERVDRLVADLDHRFASIEQGDRPPPDREGPIVIGATEPPVRQPEPRQPEPDQATQTAAAGSVLPAGTPMDQYAHAQRLVLQSRYDDAEMALREFVELYPDHSLVDNARYWLGETFYVRRRYQEAASEFLQAWQDAPDGSKAPDNLLKLALSLSALEKRDEACVTLEKLIGDYQLAGDFILDRARQERSALRCA